MAAICANKDVYINVSQGNVTTYATCSGIFDTHLTIFKNRLRCDRIMVMSLWPRFLVHPVYGQKGGLCHGISSTFSNVVARHTKFKRQPPSTNFAKYSPI